MSDFCNEITMSIKDDEPGAKVLSLTDGLTNVNVYIRVGYPMHEAGVLLIARDIQRAILMMKKYRVKKFMDAPLEEMTATNKCV